ncbi:MAG: alpha/beta hydrolase-fold protein [bacterium]
MTLVPPSHTIPRPRARLRTWGVRIAAAVALTLPTTPALAQWTTAPVSVPRLEYRTFYSAAAGATVSYHVWTPPVYDTQPARRFPVLYWLHGSDSVTNGIAQLTNWFSTAMSQGLIPPMLLVFPNGMPYGMWCDSKDGTVPMETVVIHELIPEVDARMRTRPVREGRIVEGFSMGGQGAGRFAFKYPNLFVAGSLLGAGPVMLDFMDEPTCSGAPIQLREQIYQSVWGSDSSYYLANTPWTLATRNVGGIVSSRIRLRMVTGTADCLLAQGQDLHQQLSLLGIVHDWTTPAGIGHETLPLMQALGSGNWAFYRDAFATPTADVGDCGGAGVPCPCGERANGRDCLGLTLSPNPVRGSTMVRFQLPRAGMARVRVLDPAGRLVRVVRDGWSAAGAQSERWDGLDEGGVPVSAGLYVLAVDGPEGASQRVKVVVAR